MIAATIVEWETLAEVVVNAVAAGVGVSLVYAIAILGATRLADSSREGRTVTAAGYGAVALVAFAVVIAAVVLGISAMTSK